MWCENGSSAWCRYECVLADPRADGPGRCARVATSGLSARTVRPVGPGGAAGRGSRLTTHAPQAAQTVTLPASLDEAVAALAAMPAAVPVAGRHRPHGLGQLRATAPRRARRPRPDQRDPRLAVPGRPRAPRRGPHPRPHGTPRLRRPDPGPRRRRPHRGTAADPQRGHPRRQHRLGVAPPATPCPCWPPWRRRSSSPGPGGARREVPVSHLLAGLELLRRRRTHRLTCACRCCTPRRPSSRPPAGPGPGAPSRPSRSSSTPPGVACGARSAPSRRCRCGPWRPSSGSPR